MPLSKTIPKQAASCHVATHPADMCDLVKTCRDDRDYQIVSQREHSVRMNSNLKAFHGDAVVRIVNVR